MKGIEQKYEGATKVNLGLIFEKTKHISLNRFKLIEIV